MSDKMINESSPCPKKGVPGIGDTNVQSMEYDMNKLNDTIGTENTGKKK